MGHIKITNIDSQQPLGGLDTDSEESVLSPQDVIDCLNCRYTVSYEGKVNCYSNTKGNVEVPFSYGSDTHRCIGSVEDTKSRTVVFFLWCSDSSKHKIMRYHRTDTSVANPYGTIEQLVEFPFGWTQLTKITGVNLVQDNDSELLYWTDYQPRKINIGKLSIRNKTRCWNLYVPVTPIFTNPATVTIQAKDINGVVVDQYIISIPTDDNKTSLQYIATAIMSVSTATRKVTAEACACHLEICTNDASIQRVTFAVTRNSDSQAFPTLVVPANWYGVDLIDRMFDAGKYPSGCNPLPSFEQDTNALFNFVKEQPYQFRTLYYNDDEEVTTLSPFSQIPLENIVCNPVLEERLNYVDIQFNDQSLLDPRVLVIVKEVGVTFREGNEGVEKLVERVEICEFFDMDASFNAIAHYKFYNDTNPTAIPIDDATQNFDSLPITARAQEYFRNKLIYGGITEGYDRPECLDVTLAPRILENPTPETYEVSVIIRIYNPFLSSQGVNNITGSKAPDIFSAAPLDFRGGVFQDYQTDPDPITTFYGGGFISAGTFDYNTVAGTKFKQWLPEGGWTMYAAGTDYFGISRQVPAGLPTTQNGAIITSNTQPSVENYFVTQNGDIYSIATIRVPNGTYKLRVASHWCSFGDKLGYGEYYNLNNGRNWQKTSTNVWGTTVGGIFTVDKELTVTVSGADVFAGNFIIRDMCNAVDGDGTPDNTIPCSGYLYDALGNVSSDALREEGIAVERSYVIAGNIASAATEDFTDYNGFFFFYGTSIVTFDVQAFQVNNPAGTPLRLIANTSTGTGLLASVYFGSLQQLYDNTLSVIAPLTTALNELILPTNTLDARNECSTFITGTVVDQDGNPIQDAVVIYEGGRTALTNSNGEFRIVAFGNTVGVYVSGTRVPAVNDNNRILDRLIVYVPAHCFPSYTTPQVINITITEFGANAGLIPPPYSPTAVYDVDSILGVRVIDLSAPIIYKSRKRGGNYIIGLVYYDELLRQCAVAVAKEVYIPFTTEDLNKYDPNEPVGTYRHGEALIDWTIVHNPPEWAAYYQWVITKNKNQQTYLSWAIKDAKYAVVAEDVVVAGVTTFEYTETSYENGDANLILLDISNITDYAKQNFDTNVSYTWQAGDRVRLIANDQRVYYEGLFDYEVISFEQPGFLVIRNNFSLAEIKPGTLIQVYRPRPQTEDQIYYEFGECYDCTNPGNSNNAHSVTAGTFTGGDTYFRSRSIPVYNDYSADLVEYYMECENISDFYASTAIDIGRLQLDDPTFGRMDRPALLRCSDRFLPNTRVNGLNRYRDTDSARKELERKDGVIVSLKTPDIVLQVTQESGITSVYIERTIIRDAQDQEVMGTSTNYFGTDNRMLGDYGAQFADGCVEEDSLVYGVDTTKGLSWRRADNGLFQISSYKARNYFGKYREREIWDVCAVFDGFMKEYIVTIWEKFTLDANVIAVGGEFGTGIVVEFRDPPPITTGDNVQVVYTKDGIQSTVTATVGQVGGYPLTPNQAVIFPQWETPQVERNDTVQIKYRGTADTIAFSEVITTEGRKNRWVTRYSFTPEKYESVGDEFVSWNNGSLWIHDKNTLRNNFYGVQYSMKLVPVFNSEQEVVVNHAVWLDTIQDNGQCDWSMPVISNKNGQLSRLVKGSFVKKEQYWHSEFKRDLNTQGVTNPIVNGRMMRNAHTRIELENDYSGEVILRSVNTLVEISQRNVK